MDPVIVLKASDFTSRGTFDHLILQLGWEQPVDETTIGLRISASHVELILDV